MRSLVTDRGQSVIERRLERLPREAIGVFAVREAMRAAPLLSAAREADVARLALLGLRAILTAVAALEEPGARRGAKAASDAAFAAACRERVSYPALYAAARAGAAALAPSAAAAAYAGFAAACSSARAACARTLILAEAARDLDRLEAGEAAATLQAAPLWPYGAPGAFERAVERLETICADPSAPAAAWTAWYRSKLGGWPELTPVEREAALFAWPAPPRL